MHDMVKQHLPEIEALCRKHHVRRLDVFGSAANGVLDPAHSDVDFLVEFGPGEIKAWAADFQALKSSLSDVLQRPVDLVDAPGLRNPYLKQSVEATRVPVYAEPRA
ncbi:MAG TPA: nucleotidyltransferase domain-containing protein [bacterium]